MAVNRSDSYFTSKIKKTFKACDTNNALDTNTCPTCNGSYNAIEDNKIISNSNANDVCFTRYFSEIDSDVSDTHTLNTSDMQFSSSSSILNTSFNSEFIEDTALDDDLSFNENEFDINNRCINETSPELDTISLSSSVTTVENTNKVENQNCAVLLCNENARKQFDTLFFIYFPSNTVLCNTWWVLCGRKDKFDPSSKICSIHFDPNDFKTVTVKRDNHFYRQTILKNNGIVPTLYLLPHEYTKFTRIRNKNIKDNFNSEISKASSETKKCVIQSCNKTFLKDGRSTLFFKFPLENKVLLKKWLDKIELTNWQPSETDKICSDHFENYYVTNYNNVYKLDKYAFPSIKPKNPFNIKSENYSSKKDEYNDHHFRDLEFKSLNDNVLLVCEKNNEKEKSNSLDSLVNDTEKNKQMELHNTIPETVTALSNSTERTNAISSSTKFNNSSLEYIDVLDLNNIEELQLKLDNSSSLTKQYLESFEREIAEEIKNNENPSNNNDLECIYLDFFNNETMVETQSTNTNDSLANQYSATKLELKTKTNDLKNVFTNVSNNTFSSDLTYNKCTSESVKDSLVESYDLYNNIFRETSMIPELKNNENSNDHSCVNLNMLNDDDIGQLLSFKKGTSSDEHDMTKIEVKTKEHDVQNISNVTNVINIPHTTFSSKLTEKWLIESIDNDAEVNPESITYNQDLRELHGEMLLPSCSPDCQLICFHSIPGPQRREIYNEFLMLQSVTEQNCKIAELVVLRSAIMGDSLKNCVTYHLMMDNKLIKVCRTFFINTLGITEHRLDAILKPNIYCWYSDRDTALKVNAPKQASVTIDESVTMTDFVRQSSVLLNKDYNIFVPESDTEVGMENVSVDEYEKAILFVKRIPRVISSYQMSMGMKKLFFETSICVEDMYKIYSENYIRNKTPPPFTELQFKKFYNQCMKTLLKMI